MPNRLIGIVPLSSFIPSPSDSNSSSCPDASGYLTAQSFVSQIQLHYSRRSVVDVVHFDGDANPLADLQLSAPIELTDAVSEECRFDFQKHAAIVYQPRVQLWLRHDDARSCILQGL